ncbi:MAG: hypothetical protein ACREBC_33845 [Pyrinomonadaceae bacterium]
MATLRSFSGLVSRLSVRIERLEVKVKKARSKADAALLEKETNTCRATLEQLYEHAHRSNININRYHDQLTRVKSTIERVEERLAKRKRPWWKGLLSAARNLLVTLGPVFSFLRPLGIKLLTFFGGETDGLLSAADSDPPLLSLDKPATFETMFKRSR